MATLTNEAIIAEITDKLNVIGEAEPDTLDAINLFLGHVAGTYGDKYEKNANNPVETKKMLYDKEIGSSLNIYQSLRYHQRYGTAGHKKSRLLNDLFKAMHYLLFELTRRVMHNELDNTEFKV